MTTSALVLAHAGVERAEFVLAALALLTVRWFPKRGRRFAVAGFAAFAFAASPPMAHAAHGSLTGHMLQHLVLLAVAGPLLGFAVASPGRFHGPLRRPAVRAQAFLAYPATPAVAAVLHAAAVWTWHLPTPFRWALDWWPAHALEHAAFLSTAVLVWAAVARHRSRLGGLVALGAVAFTALQNAVLGALLTFSTLALQPGTTVEDQQLAGVLMWCGAAPLQVAAAAWVVRDVLARNERRARLTGLPARHPG